MGNIFSIINLAQFLLRSAVVAICCFILYILLFRSSWEWASIFYHYENDGTLNGIEYPTIAFIVFAISILCWHTLFLPTIRGQSLFNYLKPKTILCSIDYLWYLGGFTSLVVILVELNSFNLGVLSKDRNESAVELQGSVREILDTLTAKCETLDEFLKTPKIESYDYSDEISVLAACRVIDEQPYLIKEICTSQNITTNYGDNEPSYWSNSTRDDSVTNAMNAVSNICSYEASAQNLYSESAAYDEASTRIDNDPHDRDPRWLMFPGVLIALRMVKTTAEFVGRNNKES